MTDRGLLVCASTWAFNLMELTLICVICSVQNCLGMFLISKLYYVNDVDM